MTIPPINQEKYYERRGNRLRRMTAGPGHLSARTALMANETVCQSRAGQRALLTAANLLARWCRSVRLAFPDADLRLSLAKEGAGTLHGAALAAMSRADPFGDFEAGRPAADALILQVGPGLEQEVPTPAFASWAERWEAIGWVPLRDDPPTFGSDAPIFAPSLQLAVCLGVAQLFKKAVGQREEDYLTGFRWSLWGHARRPLHAAPQSDVPVPAVVTSSGGDLGRLLQVGVGAVGSCVLYFLRLLDVTAELVLVDHDRVEVENLDRSLLFGWEDALPEKQPKVEAARKLLAGSSLLVSSFMGTWSDYVEEELGEAEPFDLWLPLANEHGVRRSMAENVPPLMLHGSTSRDWEVFVGRHIPLLEYCLHCRFPEDGRYPAAPCGAGKSATNNAPSDETEQVDPSLPFLSAAAAALVVGELLKLSVDGYRDGPNYVSGNLYGPMENVVSLRHPARTGCSTCRYLLRSVWRARHASTRYAGLAQS